MGKRMSCAGLALIALWLMSAMAAADQTVDAAVRRFNDAVAPREQSYASANAPRVAALIPTFLFVSEGGEVVQLARLRLELPAATPKSIDVIATVADGRSSRTTAALHAGTAELVIRVPDLREPGPVTLTIAADGAELGRLVYDWTPARQWTVYVTHLSHFDWGYTGTQAQVKMKWDRIIDDALALSDQTADWDPADQFHYTLDASMPLKLYLESHPEREPQIRELCRAGRWEVNAKFAHLCSPVAAPEALARELYYTKRELEPAWGVTFPTAIHTDVPGITWGDAPILAQAGVKYFLLHVNYFSRGGGTVTALDFPHAYYWQGPAGDKILFWRSFRGYNELKPFITKNINRAAPELVDLLLGIQRGGYPYDLIHFTRSGIDPIDKGEDNSFPRLELAQNIRAWNQRFAYPRIVFAVPRDFFAAFEQKYAAQIPVYAADMPDWWADGELTDARETGISRLAHHRIAEAELWSSASSLLIPHADYPGRELDSAWLGSYLYDEHTWGASMALLPPEGTIFKIKANGMIKAKDTAELFRGRALYELARRIGGDRDRVVVFNPLGWKRTGPLTMQLPAKYLNGRGDLAYALADLETGELALGQVDRNTNDGADVIFILKDVPAFGWRAYRLVPAPAEPVPGPVRADRLAIDNDALSLAFDRARGGLVSFIDKRRNRELIDPAPGYALGQPIARGQGLLDLYDLKSAARVTGISSIQGPVFSRVTVSYRLPTAPFTRIVNDYTIYRGLPDLDLQSRLEHYANIPGASKHLAFPLAAAEPEIVMNIPFAQMRPGQDQLPGFAPFYVTAEWVDLRSPEGGAAWSSLEGPIVEFNAIRTQASFLRSGGPRFDQYPVSSNPPQVYSELMHNFESTNYHFFQSGSAAWHFRITPHAPDLTPSQAGRPGIELARPLTAVGVVGSSAPELPLTGAFLELAPDSVALVTIKRADDNRGFILRLHETTGRPLTATLGFPAPIAQAFTATTTESDLAPIPFTGPAISINLSPFSLTTIRAVLNPP
jgi:hypothetical protein